MLIELFGSNNLINMENEPEDHSDTYNTTIYVFNVVVMAIIASLGIVGNGLVLAMLHKCNFSQTASGE